MSSRNFFIVYGVVTALLLGGAGYFFFKAKGDYGEVHRTFEANKSSVGRLERKPLYPDDQNVTDLKTIVEDYEVKVNKLYEALARYQRPLNLAASDVEFPNVLKEKIAAYRQLADEKGLSIAEGDSFYYGMDRYRESLPTPKIVPVLDYQLGAIDRLLALLVESGVDRLEVFEREPMPEESGAAPATEENGESVVVRYPFTVRFESDHDAYQEFINRLSNDKDYFFVIRILRVANSSPDGVGPEGREAAVPEWRDAQGNTPSVVILQEAVEMGEEEKAAFMQERGFTLSTEDVRVLFGTETVNVEAVIDLLRFTGDDVGQGSEGGNGDAVTAGAGDGAGAASQN